MTLSSGTRLGPYEVVSPLGAGGMGEVYRAKDPRLGREVAIKVLPASLANDAERLRRFEHEARSASALNHPNIVGVYDVGRVDEVSFLAMELVQGKTVRELLVSGPLPFKRALSIAAQAAEGLAKAHAAGIVHRDLKPENLMVSSDGFVKILDFGLAKLVDAPSEGETGAPTVAGAQTASGVILGTVGYMSPEQASGSPLDFRSDQFALGAILYEMLTGRRAFARTTSVDTLAAILHDEPEPVAAIRPETPTGLRWLVERCLAKEPDERYASTRDLARDLATLRDHLSEASASGAAPAVRARPHRRIAAGAALAAAAAALLIAGVLVGMRLRRAPQPKYQQVTFRLGTVRSARFSPDGQSVVYSAAWGGQPLELFTVRPGAPESRSFGGLGASEIAISSKGEMALVLRTPYLGLFPGPGTLARMPLEGGAAPREILDNVVSSDWAPDGSSLAVVRRAGSRQRLEYPSGKVLYETSGWISHPRISPDGKRVACLEHSTFGEDRGSVVVVEGSGKKQLGRTWSTVWGLAWSPDGKEIWFTAGMTGAARNLRAVSLSGEERLIVSSPVGMVLHDIARDGRALLAHENVRMGVLARGPRDSQERDLSWLDLGQVTDISPDGREMVINELGEVGYTIYLRKTDGSPAVRLGPGWLGQLSPDRKWVMATDIRTDPMRLVLLPTGPGDPIILQRERFRLEDGRFLPDARRIVFLGGEVGQPSRLYVQSVPGGEAKLISPTEVRFIGAVSPDGRSVVANDAAEFKPVLFPTEPGDPSPIRGVEPGDYAIRWSPDGTLLYVLRQETLPARVFRVNVVSGARELWKEFSPADPAGVVEVQGVVMTPDASAYAYYYIRILSDLFVAEGLK